MVFFKSLAVAVCAAAAVCSAQQKFPLRSGEWEASTHSSLAGDQPIKMLYCLNDELWTRALTQNPACTIKDLSVLPTRATYSMDCAMKVFQMKGTVTLDFDGMQHMTGKAAIDITLNGKTTSSASETDFRWKGSTCSPDDLNLRPLHKN